jgi:hypothetical protein
MAKLLTIAFAFTALAFGTFATSTITVAAPGQITLCSNAPKNYTPCPVPPPVPVRSKSQGA